MPEILVAELLVNHEKGNVRMDVILGIVRVNVSASKINNSHVSRNKGKLFPSTELTYIYP